ncbi:RNase A-like domain-containing protein [Streptomyces niveus]|uniref:RNase A-like domain-containing protein n=1 Tax=Streptomyces niveus TaxID=193462 RepID=UPI0034141F88
MTTPSPSSSSPPSPSASPSPSPSGTPPASPSDNGSSTPPGGTAPTPEPSPGGLTDPDGRDISRDDTNSARRAREEEVERLKPPPPDANGGFDVGPAHLHYVSYQLRNSQIAFSQQAGSVLGKLEENENAGGCGLGPEAFAAAYAKVAKRFFEVWDKAVEGVGGASVGLTMTANYYVGAEHRAHPTPGPPPTYPPPSVLTGKGYRPVPELGWGNPPDELGWGHDFFNTVSAGIGAVGGTVLRPILKYALRHGKVADITPGGDDLALPKISVAWTQAKGSAKKAAGEFDAAVSFVTPSSGHSEWQDAMKTFCSSIWGTTAWGKDRSGHKWAHRGGQQPALDVLMDTAQGLASGIDGFCAEVKKFRSVMEDVYIDAGRKTFEVNGFLDLISLGGGPFEYAVEFIYHLDTGRLDAAVDEYNRAVHSLAKDLDRLMPALDEAHMSVPAYSAQEARGEGFGARALNEFKQKPNYTVPGKHGENHSYPIDLANHEGVNNGHTLDKHVGKTDEQLAQRLRDQGTAPTATWQHGKPSIGGASTFASTEKAQELTQHNMDHNSAKIKEWLDGPPPPTNGDKQPFDSLAPNGEYSGRSISKQPDVNIPGTGFKYHGLEADAVPVKGIRTVLRYDDSLDPPFTVLTSMPSA